MNTYKNKSMRLDWISDYDIPNLNIPDNPNPNSTFISIFSFIIVIYLLFLSGELLLNLSEVEQLSGLLESEGEFLL